MCAAQSDHGHNCGAVPWNFRELRRFLQLHNDYLLIIISGTGDCQSFFDDNSTF